ncbi:single-stranded DNA-binding protein [Desertivirga arenae]|uniref:single-stranded DNA-binding protein n=1 Tax=Desertivirga arenae TaxID=2810309 RepID=UPI001A974B2B|nr:single-stranded DNA-binding protein [Pedobacter sp. SYSU D00823]
MSGVNKVILVGHLGKDPEIRHLEGNTSVATFTLATSESYTNKQGQRVEQTEWHNIVAWRGLADIAAKYLQKGKQVYVEGKIRSRSYDDKDGNKRYVTEIIAENMTLLGKKEGENSPASTAAGQQRQDELSSIHNSVNDDLPF